VLTPGNAPASGRSPSGLRRSQPRTSPGQRPPAPPAAEHEPDGHLSYDKGEGPAASTISEWPFQSYLELGPWPSAVPCARLHAKQVIWEWELQALADSVELIVSELVTNGVRASEGLVGSRYGGDWTPGAPPLRVWLHGQQRQVAIQVWDANDQAPTRQATDLGAEGGRGLLLVESLSTAWGLYVPPASSGKVVWAVVC
jgi:hypothetical protein